MVSKLRARGQSRSRMFQFDLLWNRVQLSLTDLYSIFLFGALCVYLAVTQPYVLAVGGIATLVAISFRLFQRGLSFAIAYDIPIRPWHLASFVLAVTAVFGQAHLPVMAQFFNSLEEATNEVIAEADTGIDEATITTIFVFFRILIILAFIIGVIIVFIQATRGNDWQPIANLLAIGVAFVIGVEVITVLMLGETG